MRDANVQQCVHGSQSREQSPEPLASVLRAASPGSCPWSPSPSVGATDNPQTLTVFARAPHRNIWPLEAYKIRESHSPGGAVSPPSADELQLHRELKQLRRENKRLKTLNRPGWIGAYSPEARKRRIARFHGKRSRRVWTKPPPRHRRRAAPAAARSPKDS